MDILNTKAVSALRKSFATAPVEQRVLAVLAAILTAVLVALVFAAPTGKGLNVVTASAEALAIAVLAFYVGLSKGTRASETQAAGGSEEVQRLNEELRRMQDALCGAVAELAQMDGSKKKYMEPDPGNGRFPGFVVRRQSPRSTSVHQFH